MKIKESHKRDFNLYVEFRKTFIDFNPFPQPLLEKGEEITLKYFITWDSTGKLNKYPLEPELFRSAQEGKMLLNLTVKMWAEGFYECGGLSFLEELKSEYNYFPDWVWQALTKQAFKNLNRG